MKLCYFSMLINHLHICCLYTLVISVEMNEKVMEKALRSGIVRYIVKPTTTNDFKGIWQFAISAITKACKNNKKPLITPSPTILTQHHRINIEDPNSEMRTHHHYLRHNYRHSNSSSSSSSASSSSKSVPKKTKVVWTQDLQARFLEAINVIGLESK